MEVQRLCSVLENHLKTRTYMVGEEYTIADIAIFPWYQQLRTGYNHLSGITASSFLSIEENYPHVNQWADRILERPAVKRGMTVCSWTSDSTKPWLVSADEQNDQK
jgi:GSH-dependent disulfide-bond oxidoreductase